jgi:hypothetical protein
MLPFYPNEFGVLLLAMQVDTVEKQTPRNTLDYRHMQLDIDYVLCIMSLNGTPRRLDKEEKK